MSWQARYSADAPDRAGVEATAGALALEFGTDWCGHCQAAQPLLRAAIEARPDLAHVKVEDGKGRPLGRSFGVKLWPTLVVLRDGVEVARVTRPGSVADVARALAALD
ncbi:thioredoxin family protein [Luteimonas sp. FCS-9]|uniref:thioredoxin family protein n=1 Tax=Luteimonas sp. FCS-9 TaxID=1547516 RepID=UPI00063EA5AA|nr:thioredoxin family protein [Luteimonas sp. FCS-9]KLJ02430.1 thioredoxin [Luteimonas sp. FCS-9]